mmetsp:Transcript_75244/g.243294  ORF Transcript_75244/g.243294 Transcript_75244/m.243294 type:complete len:235 (-) Transcript_75244:65-769(-)
MACLTKGLQGMVDLLIEAIPNSLDRAERLHFQEAVHRAQVINLRSAAARQLLSAAGLGRAPVEFGCRAVASIRGIVEGGECPVGLGGAGIDTARVFSYAEYSVVAVGGAGPQAEGQLFRESGHTHREERPPRRAKVEAPAAAWLQALRLPNSQHVDRRLCAEFQVLSELCNIFAPEGGKPAPRPTVVGVVALFTTTSPCMSCLCAIRQFQLLFPEVAIEISELDDVDLACERRD